MDNENVTPRSGTKNTSLIAGLLIGSIATAAVTNLPRDDQRNHMVGFVNGMLMYEYARCREEHMARTIRRLVATYKITKKEIYIIPDPTNSGEKHRECGIIISDKVAEM